MREGDQPASAAGLPQPRHAATDFPLGGSASAQTQRNLESCKHLQKHDT
jgi:hypothetical protein